MVSKYESGTPPLAMVISASTDEPADLYEHSTLAVAPGGGDCGLVAFGACIATPRVPPTNPADGQANVVGVSVGVGAAAAAADAAAAEVAAGAVVSGDDDRVVGAVGFPPDEQPTTVSNAVAASKSAAAFSVFIVPPLIVAP